MRSRKLLDGDFSGCTHRSSADRVGRAYHCGELEAPGPPQVLLLLMLLITPSQCPQISSQPGSMGAADIRSECTQLAAGGLRPLAVGGSGREKSTTNWGISGTHQTMGSARGTGSAATDIETGTLVKPEHIAQEKCSVTLQA
ncbi:hypothetical protein RRG08_004818 [Elysia crispata]|uniref:Uncharacterized protein n=1 Tax=Elysia crispata TaxID=231223 RepID=A0AAE0Y649_9GAST|nr:hypothetical protein RRG08_004818 [Elysia crispata]